MGPQWAGEICYREPLQEIARLPPKPALPSLASIVGSKAQPLLSLPKKLQDDPVRRDSGMSTGSSEMESSDVPEQDGMESGGDIIGAAGPSALAEDPVNDMAGWWEPRVKANLADQLPRKLRMSILSPVTITVFFLLSLL